MSLSGDGETSSVKLDDVSGSGNSMVMTIDGVAGGVSAANITNVKELQYNSGVLIYRYVRCNIIDTERKRWLCSYRNWYIREFLCEHRCVTWCVHS